ncbi:MAG TPA: hypothetical protein VMT53_06555 [Terriglobales bacterium]|nr:hypothetical protein [Terriglobales bacterium]
MRAPAIAALLLIALSPSLVQAQNAAKRASRRTISIDSGAIDNGTYRNTAFGFQYKIPFGWVNRTEQMRDPSTDPSKSALLLACFERPPEAQGNSVNSAVVITAESTSAYPELKTVADYFGPLSDVATGKGFQVVNEPYYFNVGSKRVVRGDFSKKIGQVTMYQSSLATLERGYFIAFTFLGADEAEVNELIARLQFSTASKTH